MSPTQPLRSQWYSSCAAFQERWHRGFHSTRPSTAVPPPQTAIVETLDGCRVSERLYLVFSKQFSSVNEGLNIKQNDTGKVFLDQVSSGIWSPWWRPVSLMLFSCFTSIIWSWPQSQLIKTLCDKPPDWILTFAVNVPPQSLKPCPLDSSSPAPPVNTLMTVKEINWKWDVSTYATTCIYSVNLCRKPVRVEGSVRIILDVICSLAFPGREIRRLLRGGKKSLFRDSDLISLKWVFRVI